MLRKWISDLWKDVNEACLRQLPAPMMVLERILHWFQSMSMMYGDRVDNYTQSTAIMKDVGTSLLVDALPL
ncbi:hypothetical protein MLD38_012700 [Melastoma candidum]|uniref:Uncharacterized protein n=1 Tax=Melastoma candidum TaxID=119954 RepID=A0ACB9R772_9MYRT|nr:hypothetical protein MLD38_012700 [Melastoma candidum]